MSTKKPKSLKRKIPKDNKKIKLNDIKINKPQIKIPKKHINLNKIKIGIIIIALLIIVVLFTTALQPPQNETNNTTDNNTTIPLTTVNLGNNNLGTVEKIGPYGNPNSPIKIAYILGVHPREKGSHQIMEQAIKDKSTSLNYCYYIYKINVTKNPTEFSESRMNGQLLAQQYVVPDAIKEKFNFAVDVHYSDDSWGVTRFIFTPVENNTVSHNLAHTITNHFNWTTYYTPPNPTSPEYVTTPLNNGGVPAIVYEAYTEDPRNTTYQHDIDLIDFIDQWNFNK